MSWGFLRTNSASFTAASALPVATGRREQRSKGFCSKPYARATLLYSLDINCGPLSVRQWSGMPWLAKWALVRLMTNSRVQHHLQSAHLILILILLEGQCGFRTGAQYYDLHPSLALRKGH